MELKQKTKAIHLEVALLKLNASGHCFCSIAWLVKIIEMFEHVRHQAEQDGEMAPCKIKSVI